MRLTIKTWEEFCSSYDLTHWAWDILPPNAEKIDEDVAVIPITASEFFDDPDIEYFDYADHICILADDNPENPEYWCMPYDDMPNTFYAHVVCDGRKWRLRELSTGGVR